MKKSFKYLTLSLTLASAIVLASCDRGTAPKAPTSDTSASQQTQMQQQANNTTTQAQNQASNAQANASLASDDLVNYQYLPEQIIRAFAEKNQTNKETLTVASNLFVPFLDQMAGLKYQSPAYNKVAEFANNYIQKMNSNKAFFSLYLQFAQDVTTESVAFSSVAPQYGYPSLPAKDANNTYDAYHKALVDSFKKNIVQRLDVYKDPGYQNRYFLDDKNVTDAQLMDEAKSLVMNYLDVVTDLTANDLVCKNQVTDYLKSECFRSYMQLVAELPDVLQRGSYLTAGNHIDEQVTEAFKENVAGRLVSFYNQYAKPLNLPQFSTK